MSELTLKVVRAEAEFLALQEQWQALEGECPGATLFQRFEWCRVALSAAGGDTGCDIAVYCVYSADRLVGLLPLRLQKKRFYTVLTGLAEPFQEFTEMLVAPDVSPTDIFERILPDLIASGADCLHLGQVRGDSSLFEAVDGKIPAIGESDAAPFVPLDRWDGFELYLKTVKSKTRKNMRNQRNALERAGRVTHQVAGDGELLDQIIERTYTNRAQWLMEKGLTSAAFSDAHFQRFLDTFKSGRKSGIEALGMSFRHGEELLAEQWGFVHRGRYYAFISSYNENYARLSPGKVHLGEVVRTGFEKRLHTVEFMVPNVPYKRTWASEAVPVQDHLLGFTTKGRLYAGLWVDKLRPFVKNAAMMLPGGVRRGLLAMAFWR